MSEIYTQQLLSLNAQGLIPGPNESSDDYLKRAEYCQNLENKVFSALGIEETIKKDQLALQEVFSHIVPLFDVAPLWIPIIYSNHKLPFWHGGCAWIFQLDETSPTAAFFQLRKAFEKKKSYLKFYLRDEIIAHEIAHVGRMMFNEPTFEEILAYRTSPSKFRSYFGPIVQSPWETVSFIFLLFFSFIPDFFSPTGPIIWIKLLPLGFILLGLLRLVKRQTQFKKALNNLMLLLKEDKKANAVIYRLTDDEIISFSKKSPSEILQYAKNNSTLRWQIINKAYFN